MKSAYELAVERLRKAEPGIKLTAAQKTALAELDAKYAAKIAEREIFVKGELAQAELKQDGERRVPTGHLQPLPLSLPLLIPPQGAEPQIQK